MSDRVRPDVIQYQNFERLDEINQRVLSRFQPEVSLPPIFDARPVMTKYTLFPMLDNRMPTQVPIQPNYTSPVAAYMRNIHVETDLRNQMYMTPDVYVPSSTSDLYRVDIPGGTGTGENTLHSLLFQQFIFDHHVHPNLVNTKVGTEMLHNSTRSQLRGE